VNAPIIEPTAISIALSLHRLGFNVYPLQPGSRASFGRWTERRNKRLSEVELQAKFKPKLDARPGVILDAQSRVVMIEGDGPNSEAALAELKLPPTLTVRSRRGHHYFFRWPLGHAYPTTSGFYLVEKGDGREVEFKANGITPMPPQTHHADPSVTLTFASDAPNVIAPLPANVVAIVAQFDAQQRAEREAYRKETNGLWSALLRDLIDGGHLDELVRWAGSWTAGNTRALFCPFADEHRGGEREKPSAYIITGEATGMRCDKDEHTCTVLEFLVAIGFAKDQRAAAKRLRELDFELPSSFDAKGRPAIDAGAGDLDAASEAVIAGLQETNEPVTLMIRGGAPVRVGRDERDEVTVTKLDPDGFRCVMAERLAFYSERNGVKGPEHPPRDFAINVLRKPNLVRAFPPLRGITEVPTFRPDGTLHGTPGYDPATGLYFQPASGVEVPAVPSHPSATEIAHARALILEELLGDFPFVGDHGKAHALGLALLPFARSLIDGPTPLHVIDAPVQGSGKGKLARVLLRLGRASQPITTPWPRREEEVEKRLLSLLMGGASAVIFDNVVGRMDSEAFASALTEPRYTGRILGVSTTPTLDVRTVWAMTSNNASLSKDLARRSVPIRIDPQREDPYQRDDFKHPDLDAWARDNRAALLQAALTLIAAWFAAGCPRSAARPLGSYEAWTATIGGILEVAGVPGFLTQMEQFWHEADPEAESWATFLAHWFEAHGSKPMQAKDVVAIARDVAGIPLGLNPNDFAKQSYLLGRAIGYKKDRIIGGYRIRRSGATGGSVRWICERVSDDAVPADVSADEGF
jgi:Bifunctional DNA primase/polymerase, N-terminal